MRSRAFLISAVFSLMLPISASAEEARDTGTSAMETRKDAGYANAGPGGTRVYHPIQALSYLLASKRAIGYFTRDAGHCNVTLMVAEVIDLEEATPLSAARLRISLTPGQSAALDSEEGPSIELICDTAAETLTVLKYGSTPGWIAVAE